VALVCACVPYWLAHGETEQARTWLQETQATASDLDDPHEHSWLWLRQGELAQKQGQVRQAAACFQEGFRLSRDQPEAVLRAALLTGLAEVSCQRGQLLHARIYGEEALLQARQIGRQDLLYRTLLSLSQTWYMQGDIRAARTAIAEVLAGVEHASQAGVRCRALLHYGQLCEDSGDFPQAQTNYREALRLAKHKEDKDGVCAALIALSRGMLARRMTFDEQLRLQIKPDQRELSRIRHLIEHARKVAKQLAHPGYLCRILILEGWLAHQLGDRMTMERAWSEALLLAHHLEEPLVASAALLGLGEIAMQQHQWQEATGHLVQAAALAGEGHPYRGWAELQLAKIAVEQGHYQEACRQGQAAATTFTDIGFHLAPCVQLWVEYLPERGNLLNSEKDLCNEHV
ncbi:MAG TPA: hypothetical protein VFA10_26205, partial [Ktedonobacteraceae bacterium]|nr:hypothetical protein [Ktedonobacteraceae bacterium]